MLHSPMVYTSSNFYVNFRTTFARTYHFISGEFWMDPRERHDWDEPRVNGRMVILPRRFSGSFTTSSDYRKPLAIDTRTSYWRAEKMGMDNFSFRFSPRIRFSNSFFVVYQIQQDFGRNDLGYVGRTSDNSTIFMGIRDVSTLTNTLDGLYSFSARSFASIRLRHYWRWLDYKSYHTLNPNGTISPALESSTLDRNINVNIFNIDLTYQWNFAPGSTLSVVWKNTIETSNKAVRSEYFDNLTGLFRSEQGNSISLRMLYYLDYNTLAGRLTK